MKILTYLFGVGVLGIVFSLGMTIYTGVKQSREQKVQQTVKVIPTPAIPQ